MLLSALKEKIKARMGEFWWYTLVIFLACRTGDLIQAFIGLWLVPKYVGQHELGAVLPLQQLSGFFSTPLTIVAVVFSKYVNEYATEGNYGKVRSFVSTVIALSALLFIVCIAAAWLLAPHFYERLRIQDGMLTILILLSGFAASIAMLFSSALQGLKKFRAIAITSLIGAPVRLATLLVAMPFRPLSGYVLGQTTPPAASTLVAFLALRKDLSSHPADSSWRSDVPAMLRFAMPIAVGAVVNMATSTILATIYRQRLPEIESSAHYLLSRFAEIACYVGCAVQVILFPMANESAKQGKESPKLLIRSAAASLAFAAVLAFFFFLTGKCVFAKIGVWSPYLPFVNLLPLYTLTVGLNAAVVSVTTYESAFRRFGLSYFCMACAIVGTALVACLCAPGFFDGILPPRIVDWMKAIGFANIASLTWTTLACSALQFTVLIAAKVFSSPRKQA